MTFWLDRFRKDDEEDIWEELKQMLLEQPSDQEIALKNQQEQSKIDAALERMFPDLPKQQSEPYLNYEDLFGDKKPPMGEVTGMAAPVQETPLTYRKSLSPYEEIDLKEGWSDELKAQKKEEVARIQKEAAEREWDINVENALEHGKNWTGAALEIGSAAVPGYGGAKLAGILAKKLAPKLGRKIAQEIATGTLKGASAGTVEGLGRGLREDENPLKTAAQDTLTGAVLGSAGGATGGNVERVVRGKELKQIENLKNLRKKETDYYKNYIQGTKTNHHYLGDIKFTQAGLETVSKQPNAGRDLSSLQKDLSNAEYIGFEKPHHKKHGAKDNITGFHKLQNDSKEFLVADTNKDLKYYLSKQKDDIGNRPSRVEPTSSNYIITDFNTNLNSPKNKSMSYEEWLEEEKRKRKKRGWW